MSCDEVSGEKYAKAQTEEGQPLDAADAQWPEITHTRIVIYHPEVGIILVTAAGKPDPGDTQTNKLLKEIGAKLESMTNLLRMMHKGIK